MSKICIWLYSRGHQWIKYTMKSYTTKARIWNVKSTVEYIHCLIAYIRIQDTIYIFQYIAFSCLYWIITHYRNIKDIEIYYIPSFSLFRKLSMLSNTFCCYMQVTHSLFFCFLGITYLKKKPPKILISIWRFYKIIIVYIYFPWC